MSKNLVLPAALIATLLAASCQMTPSTGTSVAPKPTPERMLYLSGLAAQTGNNGQVDLKASQERLEQAAAQGSPEAMDRLGQMYQFGEAGVSRDYAKALEWYKKEAACNDTNLGTGTRGMLAAADFTANGWGTKADPAEAENLYKKAADAARIGAGRGDATAMETLSILLAAGHGMTENDVEAWNWILKAYPQDKVNALNTMAHYYNTSQGVNNSMEAGFRCSLEAAQLGSADDMVDTSTGFMYGRGAPIDQPAAIDWINRAIDRGDSQAMTVMGNYAHNGLGVERSDTTARSWYEKAIAQNEPAALGYMGLLYYGTGSRINSTADAIAWFRKGADAGDPQSMYWLGMIYKDGAGIDRDSTQAVSWLRKSAELGWGQAITRMGTLYEDGVLVQQSDNDAGTWYAKAISVGDPEGMYRMALLVISPRRGSLPTATTNPGAATAPGAGRGNGRGRGPARPAVPAEPGSITSQVGPDYPRAQSLLTQAAILGYGPAMTRLGQIYDNGEGMGAGNNDPYSATKWYARGAAVGEIVSMREFGEKLVEGRYVGKDYTAAIQLYQQASAGGDAEATVDLGTMNELGWGTQQNSERALQLYRSAWNNGNGSAAGARALGHIYQEGAQGVPRNPQLAIQYLEQAANKGDVQAIEMLALTYELGKGILSDQTRARQYYIQAAARGSMMAQTWLASHSYISPTAVSGSSVNQPR